MKIRDQKGFSMLEMIITMGLMMLVIGIGYSIYRSVGQNYDTQSSKANSANLARLFTARMKTDIRESSGVEQASGTTLRLKTASIDRAGDPIPGSYDRITYFLRDGFLTRRVEPARGSSRARAAGRRLPVSTLSFKKDRPETVSAVLTLKDKVHRRRVVTTTYVCASVRSPR